MSKSSSESPTFGQTPSASTTLEVRAASPATEIFLVDHRFRRIASGIGELEHDVPAGFYKVRFRAGRSQVDQLIEVAGDAPRMVVQGEPVRYESAAPMEQTASAWKSHAEHSARLSRQIHDRPGRESGLFLFARETERAEEGTPWKGVSLHAQSGELVADLASGECDAQSGFGGLSLEVDPGTYRLRVETGAMGTFEMFLVTRPGWQTQAFLMVEDFIAASEHIRRPALRSTAVLMAREGSGFDPGRDDLRLADLARVGLRSGREVLSPSDLEAMVGGKFESPMLGIYGAHLLLLSSRPDHRLIEVMIDNLRGLIGQHPDVLALDLRPGATLRTTDLQFEAPPMLRASWDLIARASHRRVSLIPPDSLADRIANDLVTSVPWLLHRHKADQTAGEDTEEAPTTSFAQARRLLDQLGSLPPSDDLLEKVRSLSGRASGLNTLDRNLLKATLPIIAATAETSTESSMHGVTQARGDVARVLRAVDAPAVSIARSVGKLSRKLGLSD